MPSTGMIAQNQAPVPEQEQHPLAAEQTVQVIAEEQVPQAAGAPATPANVDAPRNRRPEHRHRRQQTPPRVAYLVAWNRVNFPEHRGRPEAAHDDSVFMVFVIQICASMTYNDYEKLLAGAFLWCLYLLQPNIALLILAGMFSPLNGPVISAIVGFNGPGHPLSMQLSPQIRAYGNGHPLWSFFRHVFYG
ncbi:uncharacterized protein [Drosophila pseudoobscura]|uniref:Uncharacterized protein n=1 Tax=Drosophila pseudoobscura pseudoobscura TaxID=46245 RepID=A0A6I8VX92_DROPS|nr:uncharacterized protein LOC117183961 [Drosophila pseudoobscura]